MSDADNASLKPAGSSGQLGTLQELPLPAAVSYAPQTIGWVLIAVLLLAAAALIAWAVWRRYRKQRYRRLALNELADIEARLTSAHADSAKRAAALAAIAALLKRTSLAVAPREQVAALSGDAWLAFLQRSNGHFDKESGALLAIASYAPLDQVQSISDYASATLIRHARDWIAHHHVEI
jgi:hypothetical protein